MRVDSNERVQRRPSGPAEKRADPLLRVSLVICTCNRAEHLRQALATLDAMSASVGWEVILVDNGSTDGTASVIQEAVSRNPRIVPLFEAAIGLGHARQTGWRHARGEIISFTDDDCYPQRDFIDAVSAVFDENDALGFVGGRILLFDPDDIALTIDTREEAVIIDHPRFIPAGELQGANLSVRRSVLSSLGGFDGRLGAGTPFPCEDIDLVAAANWAGIAGAFDPRPTVFHHHRRRAEEYARTMAGYDVGRGAYYLKYVLRPDTRRTYIAAWRERSRPFDQPESWTRLQRELRSAKSFLKRYGSVWQRIVVTPPLNVLLLFSMLKLDETTRKSAGKPL